MSIPPAARDVITDVQAATLVSEVVDAIVDGVMKGRYAPGQRLIASDLAEEYGVSRAPVREALHMLAGEGVVELTPNRGAKIRRLGVKELVDFLEFTEAICALGVRLATGHMHDAAMQARATAAFELIEEAWHRRHASDFVNALYRYHITLNGIAGNLFLDFFYKRPYIRFFTLLLAEHAPGGHWDQYILNYRLIHETICSGDGHSSVTIFVSHIRWVLRNMRSETKAPA